MRRALPLLLALAGALRAQEAPRPWLEAGFEERVRSEDWDDIIDHNDAKPDYRTHYRFRSRLWATLDPLPGLELAAGLCNENRKTTRPSTYVYDGREVFFDTLYADYRFTPDWSVRAGRQNLMRGEGFVLMDGSSGDGSRSAYYNALVLKRSWGASTLEFLAIDDPKQDTWLPVVNKISDPAEQVRLNEWDERALGLYATGRAGAATTLEAYWIFKEELDDYRPASNPLFRPDRRFHTLGARAAAQFGQGWTATGEFAAQRGRQDALPGGAARDVSAWGGYARVLKTFDAPWKPRLSLGFTGLSGQDPHSGKITAWDPVFSRWPKWSELYLYSLVPENGVAYWSNMAMWEVEARCSPLPKLELRATWYRLGALEAPAAPSAQWGTGKRRGDLWEARADVTFSDALKGHALFEHLAPGDFYAGRDGGYFLRFELTCTLKHRWF